MPNNSQSNIEIGEDPEFERRDWRAQFIAWIIVLVLILAALLGLFGGGPLSNASSVSTRDGMSIKYQRFGRLRAPMELEIVVDSNASTSGERRVWLSQEFLKAVELINVTPDAERVEAEGDGWTYVFSSKDSSSSVGIEFHYKPDRMGTIRGRLGSDSAGMATFSHFIYP